MKNLLSLFFIVPAVCSAQYDSYHHDFTRADSVALHTTGFGPADLDTLATVLTHPFSDDVDKFRAIYRWVTENIEYDVDLYLKNEKKEVRLKYDRKKLNKWRKSLVKKNRRRLFQKNMALCSGFSYLIEALCQEAGIPAVTIHGYGRTATSTIGRSRLNHAWNAVQLNSKWYLCDATWSAGYYEPLQKKFIRGFSDTYFLADPDYFIADHYPKEKSWTLLKDPISLSQFSRSPVKLQGYFNNKMVRLEPDNGIFSIRVGQKKSFRFTANEPIAGAVVAHMVSKKWNDIYTAEITRSPDGYYNADVSFSYSGTCKMYLYINGHLSLLYQVNIRD